MNSFLMDAFLDYTRLVCYALVVLCSLQGIGKRKYTNLLFIGDIIFVLLTAATLIYAHLLNASAGIWDEVFLTSGAVIWAVIHFIALLRV